MARSGYARAPLILLVRGRLPSSHRHGAYSADFRFSHSSLTHPSRGRHPVADGCESNISRGRSPGNPGLVRTNIERMFGSPLLVVPRHQSRAPPAKHLRDGSHPLRPGVVPHAHTMSRWARACSKSQRSFRARPDRGDSTAPPDQGFEVRTD